jgi:hypothetical protein
MRHAYPARQSAGVARAKDAVLAFAEASAENEFRKAVWLTDQWRRTIKTNEVLFLLKIAYEEHSLVSKPPFVAFSYRPTRFVGGFSPEEPGGIA